MNSKRLLAKLEDFRLLPIFVLFSMAVGIAIGRLLNISDFALTPPIAATRSAAFAAQSAEASLPACSSFRCPTPSRWACPSAFS